MTNYNEIGKKYDGGKPNWTLLPLDLVEEMVKVLTFGAEKYGKFNWQKLDDAQERYFAAALRHLVAYQSGEMNDKESGLSHLAHSMTNLLFLLHFNKINSNNPSSLGSLSMVTEA